MTDQELIHEIAHGNNHAFTVLYTQYRNEFFGYIRKHYKGDEDTIFDLYQDTCVALYDRIRSGKLRALNPGTKLKAPLFAIGHNKLVDLIRKNKPTAGFIENIDYKKDYDSEYSDECSARFAMVRQAVDSMTEPCCSILTLYYWDDKNMQEIADIQGYAKANLARAHKSRCMNKLRIYIKNLLG